MPSDYTTLLTPLFREFITLPPTTCLNIIVSGIQATTFRSNWSIFTKSLHGGLPENFPVSPEAFFTEQACRMLFATPHNIIHFTQRRGLTAAAALCLDLCWHTGEITNKRSVPLDFHVYDLDKRAQKNPPSISLPSNEFPYDPELFAALAYLRNRDFLTTAVVLTGITVDKLPPFNLPNVFVTNNSEDSIVIL